MRIRLLPGVVAALSLVSCARPPRPAPPADLPLVVQSRNHLEESQELVRNGEFHSALRQLELAAERLWEIELTLKEGERLPADADSLLGTLLSEYSNLLRRMDELPEDTPAWLIARETEPLAAAAKPREFTFDTAHFDMPLVMNDRVEGAIRYYTGRARNPFTLWLLRSGRYQHMMQDILASYGLPRDLVWLSLVESGFSPWAYSRAHAAGPWQFIKATAKLYGLRVTWWVDERRDPVKATHAAARYLKDLYQELGTWPLALASYNCGEGRVRRAMRRERTDDFWALRRLPRQTRHFIPRYMAAAIIGKNPEAFGFDVERHPPLEYETITLDGTVDLRLTAECLGIDYQQLRELNPELTRWCTPPGDPHYDLRVPVGLTPRYLAHMGTIRRSAPDTYKEHRVTQGESLWRISRRYGVPIAVLAEVNGIRNKSRIRIGQIIMVPVSGKDAPYESRRLSPPTRLPEKVLASADGSEADGTSTGSHPERWNAIRRGRFEVRMLDLPIEPVTVDAHPVSGG